MFDLHTCSARSHLQAVRYWNDSFVVVGGRDASVTFSVLAGWFVIRSSTCNQSGSIVFSCSLRPFSCLFSNMHSGTKTFLKGQADRLDQLLRKLIYAATRLKFDADDGTQK